MNQNSKTIRREFAARHLGTPILASLLVLLLAFAPFGGRLAAQEPADYDFHDSHFHLTNYIQQGISIEDYLAIMGDRVGRSTLFGIPLQQTWSYQNSGDFAPSYYLQSDAPLYYYSFTDAYIARLYEKLTPEQQARFDPMIVGFNPADMYATDHIKRVLNTFPGVFTGIGEFSIHKEFVSSKIAGEVASLTNPALDRIFDLCAETGLVAIMHNDIDMPFSKPKSEPVYLAQAKDMMRRHPDATIIWAHIGLGRIVHPDRSIASAGTATRSPAFMQVVQGMLTDPTLDHVYFDISWEEVAKYATETPETVQRTADVINRYPDRFLFGTDKVAPKNPEAYLIYTKCMHRCGKNCRQRQKEKPLKVIMNVCSTRRAEKCVHGKKRISKTTDDYVAFTR